ncbi:MAG: hypothetical protein OFPII_34880 [Osedax symbiont Rs1]|nr:MAG: hypothetical protein OFPII_34880 [Osedax symbiont Rs1]
MQHLFIAPLIFIWQLLESVTSLQHIVQTLDSTGVRKIPIEATGFMHICIYLANAEHISLQL